PDALDTPIERSWEAMARLVEEGKVRAAGVSNFDVELLARCAAIHPVASLQPPFSMILRGAAADSLRRAPPRGSAPAAVLDDPPRRRGGVDPVVRAARNRRDRLQPDAVGAAHPPIPRRARREPRAPRLAPAIGGGARAGAL